MSGLPDSRLSVADAQGPELPLTKRTSLRGLPRPRLQSGVQDISPVNPAGQAPLSPGPRPLPQLRVGLITKAFALTHGPWLLGPPRPSTALRRAATLHAESGPAPGSVISSWVDTAPQPSSLGSPLLTEVVAPRVRLGSQVTGSLSPQLGGGQQESRFPFFPSLPFPPTLILQLLLTPPTFCPVLPGGFHLCQAA